MRLLPVLLLWSVSSLADDRCTDWYVANEVRNGADEIVGESVDNICYDENDSIWLIDEEGRRASAGEQYSTALESAMEEAE